ncbi:hypothetical protein LUZ60_012530 [Juncus effusus]|nr:hypothetical protein LUZ60_012530 [Juncus effusus]
MGEIFMDLFEENSLFDPILLTGATSSGNFFSIVETLEDASLELHPFPLIDKSTSLLGSNIAKRVDYKMNSVKEIRAGTKRKRSESNEVTAKKGHKMSHITVERNRRKQMNENLVVLRSLMPCFYVKRGDQASIIGGVVDYIKELQQVLQSLEAKKQRKAYSEVLSPRVATSSSLLPPLSPKLGFPISPKTPLPGSPYKQKIPQNNIPNTMQILYESYPSLESTITGCRVELGEVSSKRAQIAEVKVEFSGPNVLLKTVSQRIPEQPLKIIAALESLSLEILNVNISTVDDTMLNSFTIKIGIECELSAEDLVQAIQKTFS